MINVQIYRYNPEHDVSPYMQSLSLPEEFRNRMVLDALDYLRENDPTLAYRRSCREGVCGSDGMNINGKNWLACIKPVEEAIGTSNCLTIRPLPGMPVIRDLVVDQTLFFEHYERIKPRLITHDVPPAIERRQSPEERAQLDRLYECILCGCCTSQCPSSWWNPENTRDLRHYCSRYGFFLIVVIRLEWSCCSLRMAISDTSSRRPTGTAPPM